MVRKRSCFGLNSQFWRDNPRWKLSDLSVANNCFPWHYRGRKHGDDSVKNNHFSWHIQAEEAAMS